MNNLARIAMFILGGLLAFAGLSAGFLTVTDNLNLGNATAMYNDTVVFESQADYTKFKYFLAGDDIVLQSFDELSTSLPIVISYKMDHANERGLSHEAIFTQGMG